MRKVDVVASVLFWICLWLAGPAPAATLVSTFPAGDSSWHMGTLAVGQLDNSPDLEIVVPYRDSTGSWFLDAFKYTGQRLPGFPYSAGGEEINVSPTLADLDQDGHNEILFTRGNHLIALRRDGSLLWSNTVAAANYVPTGGYQTVTNGFYWTATGGFLSHLPSTAVFSSQVSSPMVVDLTGTGSNEVVTAWKIDPDSTSSAQDYNPFISQIYGSGPWGATGEDWSGGVVFFDARTGKQTFVYHLHHLVESGLAIGHAGSRAPWDVYVLNDSDSVVCFDKTQPFGLWGKGMLHRQFGKNQRLMTGSYQMPVDLFTADIDGDGRDEVLVAGTQLSTLWQPNETMLEDDGTILWRRWLPSLSFLNNYGWLNCASLIPVNPDHDNHIDVLGFNHSFEISYRYWNGIELVSHPGWPINFYPLLPTPPVVGDVDGDGQEEIVIGTYNPSATPSSGNLLVYGLDGTLKQSLAVPGGIKQIPALADVEGAGRLDVVYRSIPGQIYIQNLGSSSTNGLSWATHRGNMRRDGNLGRALYPPGTPQITQKVSAYNRVQLAWTNSSPVQCYRIFRAEQADGPFTHVATLTASTTAYTDYGLTQGSLYFYEVGAVYATNTVHSAPVAVLAFLNNNLLANAGFEENDNSHWDKWYGGSIEMTNMLGSTDTVFAGRQSMQIRLQNQGNNSTVAQFNQYGIPDSTLYVSPGLLYSYGGYLKTGPMSRSSEQWLTWISSKTGYDTNPRPSLPWPYYFSPSLVAGTNPTPWTYVNRTFLLPTGFPNLELGYSYTVSNPASGSLYLDNLFFRPLPTPAATNWTTLIPFGSTWRYSTNPPPANWTAPTFNDSSWPAGKAKLGGGSGTTNITTRLPIMLPAYYFRTFFSVPSADLEELLLSATCTDDSGSALYPLRLFLNGTEVNTRIETVTSLGNETRYFDLTPFASLLHAGTNTAAVIISNYWSDWDAVAFDIRIQAVLYQPLGAHLSLQLASDGTPNLSIDTPTGTLWQLQEADDTPGPNWQTLQVLTNAAQTHQNFRDVAPTRRTLLPSGSHSRFYRLIPF